MFQTTVLVNAYVKENCTENVHSPQKAVVMSIQPKFNHALHEDYFYQFYCLSRKYMPKIMRYHRLAKALVSLQTILASALCFLAMWLLMWAPNLRTRDNPYWSAIPLLLSGILGLVLLCCCRKEYPGMPNEYSVITTKVFSIILTTISGAVCLIAAAFAIIHLVSLSVMVCSPPNQSNSTCFCKVTIDSYHYNQSVSPLIKSYHYMDLTCPEVDNVLTILLICSGIVNAISAIIALWYVYLHWASRYYYTYSKVRTKENKPIILTNA
ncbi:sarcospan isoform X2 [Agrilus planipennis]|uniref:Sarcospan isoform X2 n=1 Tax=Agrilus planipennis TaxID=224129 RepID=A0A7F5R9B5_AGRPL|nr:sarcospan isoform X2 [Agrilus planipennis]